jgi:divalent metal cation (Fe/Co/Zn/Cd) transporter
MLAVPTGSVGLLGDAIHNLSDVSTRAVVFLGFRLSRRPATGRYPYGLERAEDLAGIGIALVIWTSAAFARYKSVRPLIGHGHTTHVGAGIAGALLGIVGNHVAARYKGDPVAGVAVTWFICHVGYEATKDVVRRLADGIDPQLITTAEAAAGSVPGVVHAHARARWTGRTLRVEIEAWVDPELTARQADALGRLVADEISRQLPKAGSLTWAARAAP